MPHRLIKELRKLAAADIASVADTTNPYLTDFSRDLPDDILDQLELIEKLARETFGPRLEPTVRQGTIMREEGFPVSIGKHTSAVWFTGVIKTPKGLISYS
jgi:hypothetical protein